MKANPYKIFYWGWDWDVGHRERSNVSNINKIPFLLHFTSMVSVTFLFVWFEIQSYYIVQAGLELIVELGLVILAQTRKCLEYHPMPLYPLSGTF